MTRWSARRRSLAQIDHNRVHHELHWAALQLSPMDLCRKTIGVTSLAGNGEKAGSLALIQSVFTIAFFTSTTSGSTYRDVVSGNDIQSSSLASDIRRHGASLHWPLLSTHTEVARTYEAEELFFDLQVGQHALAAQEVLQEARFQHSQRGRPRKE